MQKERVLLSDSEINFLVKKSKWVFWIFGIILLGPVIGFIIGYIDALLYESDNSFYQMLLLAGLATSFLLFLLFVLKINPRAVRKKYNSSYKIIEVLMIKGVRESKHSKNDNTGGYSLYYMTLSNNKDYDIELSDYRDIESGKYSYARLESAEKNGKTISCKLCDPPETDTLYSPEVYLR